MRKLKDCRFIMGIYCRNTDIPGRSGTVCYSCYYTGKRRLQSIYIGNGNTDRYSCRCAVSFSNSGETIDNMELDFFLGEAVVVRVTDKKADEAITLEDIEPYKEEICEGKIVLFNTNWYKTRGTDEFSTIHM